MCAAKECLNLFPNGGKGLLSGYKIFQHRGHGGTRGTAFVRFLPQQRTTGAEASFSFWGLDAALEGPLFHIAFRALKVPRCFRALVYAIARELRSRTAEGGCPHINIRAGRRGARLARGADEMRPLLHELFAAYG